MANGDTPILPQLADPETLKKRASKTATATPAGGGGPFGALLERLNSIEDPLTKSIMQGAMEAKISERLGFRFHFPDPAEEILQRQQTMNQLQEEQIKGAVLSVQMARAAALDAGMTEDVFVTDPDRAVRVSNEMFEAGMIASPVTKGMLALANMETDSAKVKQEAGRKELGEAATAAGHAEKQAERFAQAAEGEGVIGGALKAKQAEFEGATDEDLDDDIDEARGSEVFYAFADKAVRDVSVATGQTPKFLATAMMSGEIGKNLKDQLEGLETNDQGQLIVTSSDSGIDETATFYLAASLMNLSAQADISTADGMRMAGLPYAGIDLPSLEAALTRQAKKRGVTEQVLGASLGPSFIDAVRRMAAEQQAVGAATK